MEASSLEFNVFTGSRFQSSAARVLTFVDMKYSRSKSLLITFKAWPNLTSGYRYCMPRMGQSGAGDLQGGPSKHQCLGKKTERCFCVKTYQLSPVLTLFFFAVHTCCLFNSFSYVEPLTLCVFFHLISWYIFLILMSHSYSSVNHVNVFARFVLVTPLIVL